MEFSEIYNHDEAHESVSGGMRCMRRAQRFQERENISLSDIQNGLCESWPVDDLFYDASVMSEGEPIFDDKYGLLSWLLSKAALSPCGNAMLDEVMSEGWSLGLEDLSNGSASGPDFHLDVPQKLIILDNNALLLSAISRSEYFRNMILVSLIRALRDVWQEKRHGDFSETYGPESIMALQRVRAADLDVMSILVAWEMRGENFGSTWRYLIGSEDGDLAMRFSGYLERDPSSSFNGKALAACFKQWFRDDSRVARCEHEALNELDQLVEMQQDAEISIGTKVVSAIGVEILSCLPDKTAYLQGHGDEILRDPHYAGLNDAVNQAHFMQVLYDMRVTRIADVPFQDADLARKIFPVE